MLNREVEKPTSMPWRLCALSQTLRAEGTKCELGTDNLTKDDDPRVLNGGNALLFSVFSSLLPMPSCN